MLKSCMSSYVNRKVSSTWHCEAVPLIRFVWVVWFQKITYIHIYIYVYTHYDLYTTLNIPPPVGWSRIFIYTVISYTIMIYWSWCITCNIKNMQTMNTTLTCGLLRYVFELNEHHAGTTSNCIYIILHITIVARSRMCIHSCKELQTCTV